MSNRYSPVRPLLFLAAGTTLLVLGVIFRGTLAASPWLEYAVFGAAYLVAGWNVLAGAARSIVRGRVFDENFLMTVATGGAFAIHQLWEAVAVMIFYKVGEILEDLSVDRSRRSIGGLLELRPDVARVRRDGAFIELRPEQVAVGEEIAVRPGERVPLDGIVLSGSGFVDTSALTGESVPRRVEPGQRGARRVHQHGRLADGALDEERRGVKRGQDHLPGGGRDAGQGKDRDLHQEIRQDLHPARGGRRGAGCLCSASRCPRRLTP